MVTIFFVALTGFCFGYMFGVALSMSKISLLPKKQPDSTSKKIKGFK